jgi:ketosteroid isomerase-like protein
MKTILILVVAALAMLLPLQGQTNKQEIADQSGSSKVEQALATLEQEWADAVKRRDVEKIDQIDAKEYEFTGPAGQVWTKARELDTIRSGELVIDSFELSELNVRCYDNTAVVTLRIVWQGKFRSTDISGPQRMTDVFVKRDGRWQCVASQATRILSP